MNENAVQGRPEQIAEAEQTIRVLSGELLKHKGVADKWAIDATVQLVQDQDSGYCIEITGKTAGGRGHIITMTADDVRKYADDPKSAAINISDAMLSMILKDLVREEFVSKIVRALNNAAKLSKSVL